MQIDLIYLVKSGLFLKVPCYSEAISKSDYLSLTKDLSSPVTLNARFNGELLMELFLELSSEQDITFQPWDSRKVTRLGFLSKMENAEIECALDIRNSSKDYICILASNEYPVYNRKQIKFFFSVRTDLLMKISWETQNGPNPEDEEAFLQFLLGKDLPSPFLKYPEISSFFESG